VADDCALRDKAREAMEQARLPARQPDRMLGGLGSSATCALCGIELKRDEMELEIELMRDRYHLHPRCFIAWELEREDFEMVQDASPASSDPVVP